MNVLTLTLLACLIFGAVAFWYDVVRRERLAASASRRETFRMAVGMTVCAAFSLSLLLMGVHRMLAFLMTAGFVIAMTPLYQRLICRMGASTSDSGVTFLGATGFVGVAAVCRRTIIAHHSLQLHDYTDESKRTKEWIDRGAMLWHSDGVRVDSTKEG